MNIFTRDQMKTRNSKTLVMIGGFGHEGITSIADSLGYTISNLSLPSFVQAKTWVKRANVIKDLQKAGNLAATSIYFHTTLLLKASVPPYRDAFLEILNEAKKSKLIIFVFQDNLDGIFGMRRDQNEEPLTLNELYLLLENKPDSWNWSDQEVIWEGLTENSIQLNISRLEMYESHKEEVNSLINELYNSGAEISPFLKRSSVTIRLQEFLNDIDNNVFLRLYVQNDRLQAEQLKSLLTVLERYLHEIEHQTFSIDFHKSDKGIIYIFKADANLSNIESLNNAFIRFDNFMKLCGDKPLEAEAILKTSGLDNIQAAFTIDKYARDYKRLILDTRHEFERKSLMLKQNLEKDLLEGGVSPIISSTEMNLPGLLSAISTGGNVEINIGNISISQAHNVQTEVDKIVNGSISYNDNDKALLDLIKRYADGIQAFQYRSDIDQLKDQSTSDSEKKSAKERLFIFLRKTSAKAGEVVEKVAVETLSKYLQSLTKTG